MSKLDYDDKRLLLFTSTCVGVALIVGLIIGYLIPPSQNKINNQATIQNFNKAHSNMLSSRDFLEYSDDAKINFISGYELGFQQGREQEISKYNQNKAQKQELLNIEREINYFNKLKGL